MPIDTLILKVVVTPILIAAASLAGRRWGQSVSGWLVGLPLGYLLCFGWGLGVVGLWWGLSTGLIICGIGLLRVWIREGRRLTD